MIFRQIKLWKMSDAADIFQLLAITPEQIGQRDQFISVTYKRIHHMLI